MLESIRNLIRHRELLVSLTVRDIRVRYKQTLMGVGWAFFMPVTLMILFHAVFSRIARFDTQGSPYTVFAYIGLLPWSFFANSVKFSSNSLIGNMSLITKVYFPREVLPLGCVGACLFDTAIAAVALGGMMVWYRLPLHPAALLLPLVFAVQLLFTAAVAMFVAMASLFYRDVKYILDVVLMVLMFGTSVVYPVPPIGGVAGALLAANPLSIFIDAYRSLLLRGEIPRLLPLAITAFATLIVLGGTWRLFHEAEYRFAERI